jgi:hypothetical protein
MIIEKKLSYVNNLQLILFIKPSSIVILDIFKWQGK